MAAVVLLSGAGVAAANPGWLSGFRTGGGSGNNGSGNGKPSTSTELMVGAAVRDITPTSDMVPLTRAPSVTLDGGVLDDLHVRVIAISSGSGISLVVSSETGKGPYGPQYAQAVAEHTNLPLESVFLTATHSHAAPEITERQDLVFEEGSTVTNLQRWAKYVMDQMLDAADEAIAGMTEATVGIGYSESYVNVNRNSAYNEVDSDGNVSEYNYLGYNATGATDHTLAAIQFNDASTDEPIAFIVNYAVHGTVMHANTIDDGATAISADIPGMISADLEAKYPGSVGVWLSGAAGDQNPIVQNDMYSRDPVTGEFTETFSDNHDILTYLARINFADTETALSNIEEFRSDVQVSCDYTDGVIPATDGGDYPVSMQLLRIGDIALAGFSGELFSSIGVQLKEESPLENTLVVNHVWQRDYQSTGYHADDAAIEAGGFGTNASYEVGYLAPTLSSMLTTLIDETDQYTLNGDGTATSKKNKNRTVIVGLDGRPGTSDDNQVVSPTGEVLLEDVDVSWDSSGTAHVALGNGFDLYAGADAKLGTTDDVIQGFGSYPQTDATGATSQPLNWRLLDIDDGKAVIIADTLLDSVVFNPADDSSAWEDSNLRSWLNSTGGTNAAGSTTGFYDTAFSDQDKAKIALTTVSMQSTTGFVAYNRTLSSDWWQQYSTSGTDTEDYVLALSGEEVFSYLGSSSIATEEELGHDPANYTNGYFEPSAYALAQGVKINEGGNGASFVGFGDSWTRSAGAETDGTDYYGVFLGSTGSLNSGRPVTKAYGALPVVTVQL